MQGITRQIIRLTESDWPDRHVGKLFTFGALYGAGHLIVWAVR